MDTGLGIFDVASLFISTVTALCAIYISYVALKQSARPRIDTVLLNGSTVRCGEETLFRFEIRNIGYWYATPPAINITVFFNFDPTFDLRELQYGSDQGTLNTHVRVGKGGMKFLRATGLKLLDRGSAECSDILAVPPTIPGDYRVVVSAFSENGGSTSCEFKILCNKKKQLSE